MKRREMMFTMMDSKNIFNISALPAYILQCLQTAHYCSGQYYGVHYNDRFQISLSVSNSVLSCSQTRAVG